MATLRADAKKKEVVLLLAVCVVSAMLGFVFRSGKVSVARAYQPQGIQHASDKVIDRDEKVVDRKEYPDEPFGFSGLSVKNTKIAPRQKFNANSLAEKGEGQAEDWLEKLEFTVKNKWNRQITYIDVDLDFPETGSDQPLMVYSLDVGIHPKASGEALQHRTPLALEPGEKFTFTLSDHKLKLIKEFLALREVRLAELTRAVLRISYVIFDDGTMWQQGDWYRPNPNVPGGYERIN